MSRASGVAPVYDLVVEREEEAGLARIREAFEEMSRAAARAARLLPEAITEAAALCARSLSRGGTIYACGNGGSAADASHFVAELVGRMGMERAPLAAVSLGVDPSVVTCIANDYGYDQLFARQIRGLGRPGDVLLGISTSGRSANVLNALEAARAGGVRTIALVGQGGAASLELADVLLRMPADDTARVQELHTATLHTLCDAVERRLFL